MLTQTAPVLYCAWPRMTDILFQGLTLSTCLTLQRNNLQSVDIRYDGDERRIKLFTEIKRGKTTTLKPHCFGVCDNCVFISVFLVNWTKPAVITIDD